MLALSVDSVVTGFTLRVTGDPAAAMPALRAASQAAGLQELAILSTCNRTEFYGAAEQSATQVRQRMLEWIARERGLAAGLVLAILADTEEQLRVRYFQLQELVRSHGPRYSHPPSSVGYLLPDRRRQRRRTVERAAPRD